MNFGRAILSDCTLGQAIAQGLVTPQQLVTQLLLQECALSTQSDNVIAAAAGDGLPMLQESPAYVRGTVHGWPTQWFELYNQTMAIHVHPNGM